MRVLILGPSLHFSSLAARSFPHSEESDGFTAVDASIKCLLNSKEIHSVSLISLSQGISEPLTCTHKRLNISLIPVRTSAKEKIKDLFRKEREMIAVAIKKQEFDLIICHWFYEYALSVPKEFSSRMMILQHDSPMRFTALDPSVMQITKIVLAVMSRIKHRQATFVAVSSQTARINRLELIILKKQFVIPNALGLESDKYLNRDRKKRVLYIGEVSRRKNPKAAAKTFSKIAQKRLDFEFYMIGPGLEFDSKLAKRYSKMESIRWIGRVSHSKLMDLISESYMVVSCSKHESFGMTCMEALALGTKFISRRKLNSFQEICEDQNFALLSSPNSFQDDLEAFLNSGYNVEEGLATIESIRQTYGCHTYVGKLINLYRTVVMK